LHSLTKREIAVITMIPMLVIIIWCERHRNVVYRITHFPPIGARLPSAWPPNMVFMIQKPKPWMILNRLGTMVP
jgi:hypothetical protein